MKSYKFLVLIISLLFTGSNFAQEFNKEVESEFEEIFNDPYFQKTLLSVSIFDLSDSTLLFEKNSHMLLHPASNMKIITTIAGLEFLDTIFSFNTSVYYTGIVLDSVCYGDLFIVGGMDPDFTVEDLDTMAMQIKNFGIKEIRGNIYGDVSIMDSLYWGNGWMWDDNPYSDFPYMTPLIVEDVSIQVEYQPSIIGNPVRYKLIPETNYLEVLNSSVTTGEDTSDFDITRDWMNGSNKILITGDLSYKAEIDTVKLNLVDPVYYFLYLLKERLESDSVKLFGRLDTLSLPNYAHPIYTKRRKFTEIIDNLNKESDNLSAEMTLRALSLINKHKPASADGGIELIDSLITNLGLDYTNYKIVDGSGVSHYNLVTTDLIIELLKYIYYQSKDKYKILKHSFPIAGIDGTLKNRMKYGDAYKNVFAKTGTLSGVSTLSGYLTSKDNHDIVFSIFIQNFVGSSRIARRYQDRICEFLSDLIVNKKSHNE